MPARHGNHVKAKSKKIQDEAKVTLTNIANTPAFVLRSVRVASKRVTAAAKALGFHGVCTFGKICNKRDCALYHPAGWLKGPDEDVALPTPSAAEAAEVIARRSRRVVSEGAVNPNFVLAEQKKLMREERIAQNAALATADLLREEGPRRTRKASQRLSESVDDEPEIEATTKKPEDLEAVRRVQEKLALKREQQQREQEAERAAEETRIREREQEKERLKQEKAERRERLKIERQEAKAKGPEEYEKWCQSRRTMSCNSETADLDLDLTQLHPTLSDPHSSSESATSFSEFPNGQTNHQGQEDQVMFHPDSQQQGNEFVTNYTNEPLQPYPFHLGTNTQVRSRGPLGMAHLPWTCVGCAYVNYNPATSLCGQCGSLRVQLEQPYVSQDGQAYGKPPSYSGAHPQEIYDWHNTQHNDRHTASDPTKVNQSEMLRPDDMGRSHSTQVRPQNGHAPAEHQLPRYSAPEPNESMFRSFGPRPLGNGVFADFSRVHHDSRQFTDWQKPTFRTVDELLESLNLSCLSSIFSAEDIDLAALKLLKQSHLTDMGIKLGPRVKLMKAIESL